MERSIVAVNKNIEKEYKMLLTKQQYEKLFEMDGIKLEFDKGAIEAIADKAIELNTGARGLRTIIENAMMDLMFTAPGRKDIEKVVITREFITGGAQPIITNKKVA